jgi:DHA2 family multidrug resistance protein-like MFS transporter
MTAAAQAGSDAGAQGTAPARQGLVLGALILVAGVANLNLAVANVALPDIGDHFDASQTGLNVVAVGFSLGLAASVLYLGALGDRYGRKMLLVLGMALSVPACILAATAPSIEVLALARLVGGVAAGMAYPTTLALIAALWTGPGRTRSIALWSGVGGAFSALGPLLAGALLLHFYWGSVFLVTLPLAAIALVLAVVLVPGHVNETTEPVDNLGGIVSVLMVAGVVLAINFAPMPGQLALAVGLGIIGLAAGVAFVIRQKRAANPLYDLHIAGRRIFWVAAVAGIIVFGSLMGAMFIGQQFLQNVLGYDTFEAGLAILPAAAMMVVFAPLSGRMVLLRGSRFTLLVGYLACLLGFVTMLVFWDQDSSYLPVGLSYALVGMGVGMAGTPASRSLTGSVPVHRAGMASGTADLQRDLGGAVMQSILGALLTAGYAAAFGRAITTAEATNQTTISDEVTAQLQRSYSGALETAQQYPQYADQIVSAARTSFVDGANWAYFTGMVAMIGGAALVFFLFPKRDDERTLLAGYADEDRARPAPTARPRR